MEANELRIGNLVHTIYRTSDDIIKITQIRDAVVSGSFVKGERDFIRGISLTSLRPIPLTEELTLKVAPQLYKEGLEVQKSTFDETYMLLDLHTGQCIRADIKYVHEFQNLYHALTGEELEYQA